MATARLALRKAVLSYSTVTASTSVVSSINTRALTYSTLSGSTINASSLFLNGSQITSGGASSQWSTIGSTISYTAGSVGIGTTIPRYAMDVAGSVNVTGGLYVNGTAFSGGSSQWSTIGSTISYTGSVGIGTTAPQYAMDVVGTVNVTGGLYVNGAPYTLGGGIIVPNTTGLNSNTWSTSNGITWISSCSPSAASAAHAAFNNTHAYGQNWLGQLSPSGQYNSSGNYIGSVSTTVLGGIGAISGEWVQIQSSFALTLYSYIFAVGSWQAQQKNMYVVGSNDGTNWYPLQRIVLAANPFTTDFSKAKTSVLMNYAGTQIVTADTTQNATTTTYSYTTQTFTYFRFITVSNFLTFQDCGQIGELYLAFTTPSSSGTTSQWSTIGSTISYTGNVGIGTTAPQYKLDVAGSVNVTGGLYVNGSAFSGGSSQWSTIGSNLSYTTGSVGIGISNPAYKLHVGAIDNFSSLTSYLGSGGLGYYGGNLTNSTSLYLTAWGMSAAAWGVSSDKRIKTNIESVSSILEIIDQVNVVKYDYIDPRLGREECSVVAQELQEIFPNAINITTDYVPNIFKRCSHTLNDNIITLSVTLDNIAAIKVGAMLKIMISDDNGTTEREVITPIIAVSFTEHTIQVSMWKDYSDTSVVCVYGTEVDDFLSVDKPQLGVMALQGVKELHQVIRQQEERIVRLETLLSSRAV